jgi:2,4-dienoyl-CoA reductase-like NADH-dependent reductase (Old Yellow Enzyme family)
MSFSMLFAPLTVGPYRLSHRVIMAPLTRMRAQDGTVAAHVLIGAGGFDGASAEATVASGRADAIAFGRAFIANPDLPTLLKLNIPLNPHNRATFYGGGAAGYTDYSRYDA